MLAMDTLLLNPYSLENICRLCLNESGGIYIFENCFLPDNILSITGIKVQHLDKLPNNLCTNCFKIIQLAIDFRQSVAKCQEILDVFVKSHSNTELTISNESSEQGTCIKKENFKESDCLAGKEGNACKNHSIIHVQDDLYSNQSPNDTELNKESGMNMEISRLNSVINSNTKEPIQSSVTNIQKDDVHSESDKRSSRTERLITRNMKKKNEQRDVGHVIAQGNVRSLLSKIKFEEDAQGNVRESLLKKIKFEEDATYHCDSCSKFYVTRKKLYLHKRTHNKVHQCTVEGCEKRFATNGDLQKHTRTHTGDKPFSCTVCSKRFSQKVLLKSHKETIHGITLETSSNET